MPKYGLQQQLWMTGSEALLIELEQSREEGKEVSDLEQRVAQVMAMPEGLEKERCAEEIYDELQKRPAALSEEEPETLEGILKKRPEKVPMPKEVSVEDEELHQRLLGAWLGRSSGCLLGKPIECWYRDRIVGFLKDTGNFPPHTYLRSDVDPAILERYGINDDVKHYAGFVNNGKGMPEDDDTNYTMIGLHIIEEYGCNFCAENAAQVWLERLPFLHLCTAERVAYRNLTQRILPPFSGIKNNAYREWIGAQIRADFFGYASLGDVEAAARMAYEDGIVSHVKNGVYGEMFVAAMLAAAYHSRDPKWIIEVGLGQIPAHCRLAESIRQVLGWYDSQITYEEAVERVRQQYDETSQHHWCHVISNAMIVSIALLYGEMDLESTIGKAILPGFDTDCNAATAGSVVGLAIGAQELPEHWVQPLLEGGISFGLVGDHKCSFESLAKRSVEIIRHKQSSSLGADDISLQAMG